MFGPLLTSVGEVLQPQYLLPLAIGTLAGLIGGALPGVTITMTIIIVLIFGVLGYLLVKFGFPLAPLILGDQIEINRVRSLMTDADPWLFLTRPISGVLLALSVLSVVVALWQHRCQYRRGAPAEAADTDF